MRKRNAKPFLFKTSGDFIEQEIIPATDEDRCLFQNSDIKKLKESGLLPAEAVIRPFDPRVKADFISETWICFFNYPFSIVAFEDLVRPRKDSEVRLKSLFKIPAEDRVFRLEEETGETSAIVEKATESMASGMMKTKSFSLIDLDELIEDQPVVKQEHSKTITASPRIPTTRQKSAAQKKRKSTTAAEIDPPVEMTITYAIEKLQTLSNFLGSKVESYYQMYQEAESSKKEAEASKYEAESKLADLLKAISIKDLLLKKKDKEIADLKISFESEKKELLDNSKKCAAASILESMLKMSDEVHAKGYVMTSWNFEAWKKKLRKLRGESVDEDDTAGTSEAAKVDGADAEEPKDGDKVELEKKEGEDDGVEGEKVQA